MEKTSKGLRPKNPHQIANFLSNIARRQKLFFIQTHANLHQHDCRAKVEGNIYFEIGEWKKTSCKHQPNEKKLKIQRKLRPEKTFVKLYSVPRAHFHQIEKCAGILTMTARYLSALLSVALKKLQIDICSKSV